MCALFVSSCSDENATLLDSESSPTLRASGDGLYDVLGQGYDITEEYLHPQSVKAPIIDITKYKKDFPNRVIPETAAWGGDKMYYGYSSTDYLYDITKESNASTKIENTAKAFCGTFSNNSYFKSSYSYSSKYSFASVDAIRNKKRIYINDEVSIYSKYLTPEFLEDLNRLSADRLVERYGTHVLSDITIGGRYKIMFKSVIENTNNSITKKNTVAAGLSFVLKKIGFSFNVDRSITINETLAKENRNKELLVYFYGGTGTSINYDLETGSPTNIDLKNWESTINTNNNVLTNINWKETYPIYDFIVNPTKKAQVKAAVEKYIASKQLVAIEVKPLYRYWNSNYNDHYYTTNFDDKASYEKVGYSYDWIEGYLCKNQESGTVPLYRYWNEKKKDHYYTTNPNDKASYEKAGYRYDWIEGYVYKSPAEGRTPLYRYWNGKKNDHYFTTNPDDKIPYGKAGYSYDWVEAYILPRN